MSKVRPGMFRYSFKYKSGFFSVTWIISPSVSAPCDIWNDYINDWASRQNREDLDLAFAKTGGFLIDFPEGTSVYMAIAELNRRVDEAKKNKKSSKMSAMKIVLTDMLEDYINPKKSGEEQEPTPTTIPPLTTKPMDSLHALPVSDGIPFSAGFFCPHDVQPQFPSQDHFLALSLAAAGRQMLRLLRK